MQQILPEDGGQPKHVTANKVQYTLMLYVHWLSLTDCSHSQYTDRTTCPADPCRAGPHRNCFSLRICPLPLSLALISYEVAKLSNNNRTRRTPNFIHATCPSAVARVCQYENPLRYITQDEATDVLTPRRTKHHGVCLAEIT